jgi:quercetin dioxygenase-like cupin family protein
MAEYDGVTVRRQDEFERTGNWMLARRSLGITSFGMNLVEIPPGERIPEHDEAGRDHEEVFIVLEGAPTLLVDDREIPAPAGTYARLDPPVRRTMFNATEEPATVLIVSAPRTSGFEPLGWA